MPRPNIVVVMADQWRGDCLSSAGHPVVATPFLDRLARRGARFAHAYSATPSCLPARVSLLTGLRPTTHGRVGYEDGITWDYPVTLASEFTANGYQTEAVGKMHFTPERAQLGFQHVVLHSPTGIIRQAQREGRDPDTVDDYLPWLRGHLGRDATFADHGIDSNSWVARPWDKPEYVHPTNFVADRAADFLRRRDPTKPFVLFASFNAPHPPYDPPSWAFEQYLHTSMPPPASGDWDDMFNARSNADDPTSPVAILDPETLQRARAGYFGHISHVDQQINYLLEQLDQRGLGSNTYVCFLSDHGEMLGDHRLFRKSFPYEGSAHIPMIIAGPDIPAGTVSDEVVELGDVMPTLLDLAGLPIPRQVEGISFRAAAQGKQQRVRAWLHGEHTIWHESMQWLTDGRRKYIWHSGIGTEQLFDLVDDPGESHDLARDQAYADELARWRARLIDELSGRPEGFTDGRELIPGRPVRPTLR